MRRMVVALALMLGIFACIQAYEDQRAKPPKPVTNLRVTIR